MLCLWLVTVNKVAADNNTLSVANIEVPQGGKATVEIMYNFTTEFVGFQLDMELPDDGMLTPTMVNSKPVATLGFSGTDHSLSNSQLKNESQELIPSYRFLCASLQNTAVPTGQGTLIRMDLNADASAIIGTVYNVTITGMQFGTIGGDKFVPADIVFTATIVENRVVLDENSTTAPEASDGAVNVKVKRTIAKDIWNTICLPFAMTEEQTKATFGNDVQIADFKGYDTVEDENENIVGLIVNFDFVTSIADNHPYLIKVSNNITEFSVDEVVITPEDEPCVTFGFETGKGKNTVYHPIDFTGTYVADFDFYNEATSRALFLSGNKFYYATENTTHMKAFRGYFDFDDVLPSAEGASSRINMSFNNETTAMKDVENQIVVENHYYDLQGRRTEKPLKGIYIVNGHKKFVK